MAHIADHYAHQAYRLVQSAFSYNGECSICTRENTDNFSLHQISQEEYDELDHGPVVKKDHFQGIYKDVEIESRSSESTTNVTTKVFHQVAYTTSGKRFVFSPMHSACAECINTLKKTDKIFKCHICRFEIKTNKKKTKLRTLENPITINTLFVQNHLRVYPRVRRIARNEDDLLFASLSKSQKRSHLSHIRNNIEAIGIDMYLEDDDFFLTEDAEIQAYEGPGIESAFSSTRVRNLLLSEVIDFDNIPRMKTRKRNSTMTSKKTYGSVEI